MIKLENIAPKDLGRLVKVSIGSWNRLFYYSLTKFSALLKLYSLVQFSLFTELVLLIKPLPFICIRDWKDLGHLNTLKFAQTFILRALLVYSHSSLKKNVWGASNFYANIYTFHVNILFSELCKMIIMYIFTLKFYHWLPLRIWSIWKSHSQNLVLLYQWRSNAHLNQIHANTLTK